jgi:hypothetical protein
LGKDILSGKTEFEKSTFDGLIEELYLVVELVLDAVGRLVEGKENETQEQH